jgi:hypothetical protein
MQRFEHPPLSSAQEPRATLHHLRGRLHPEPVATYASRVVARVVSEGNVNSSVQHFTESSQAHDRRVSQRILPKTLIYVACGESNGGMVLNVSDDGLAVSMAIAVGDEAYAHLNVRMNGLPQSIEVPGRMVWTTKSQKRAGIQLMDVSDTQREQIREWIALEGVRDVNLLPRAVADDVASARVSTADAVNPMAFAEPRSALLDAFGGTPPETLGPPLPELFASTAAAAAEPLRSQGFDDVRASGFRENEWDLASVAMVPRKKPKPEGLSAFALILLWIAIPSFAIGILVGRRPLEQWLSRGDALGKGLSRKSPSQTLPSTPDISATGRRADVKFSQEIPPSLPINTEPFENEVLTIKPAETYRPGGSSALVDAKLLNSMSTQEARAFKNVGSVSAASATSTNKNDADKKPAIAANTSAASEMTQPESTSSLVNVIPPKVTGGLGGVAPSTTAASAQVQNTTMTLVANSANSNSSVLKADASKDVNSSTVRQNSLAPGVRSATPPVNVPASTSAPVLPSSNPDPNRNAVQSTVSNNAHAALSAFNAPPLSASPPPPNPSVAPSVAPDAAPKLAPLSIQPPLRGVMNIARSTDQAFVLKLPAESLPGGQAASMRMQRFVMVPQRGRWHHRNAVAKLTVGELLTQVPPEKPDAKIQPRQGDTVTVRAFVDKDGAVRDLKPVSGRFALMPRVMRTVREWQFDQTLVDGKPVESEVNVTVEYRGAN